jgi:hypothetical protein
MGVKRKGSGSLTGVSWFARFLGCILLWFINADKVEGFLKHKVLDVDKIEGKLKSLKEKGDDENYSSLLEYLKCFFPEAESGSLGENPKILTGSVEA